LLIASSSPGFGSAIGDLRDLIRRGRRWEQGDAKALQLLSELSVVETVDEVLSSKNGWEDIFGGVE